MTHIGNGIEEGAYVSTGELPDRELVKPLLDEAHERHRHADEGETST
jgi:hypothetical protein